MLLAGFGPLSRILNQLGIDVKLVEHFALLKESPDFIWELHSTHVCFLDERLNLSDHFSFFFFYHFFKLLWIILVELDLFIESSLFHCLWVV